MKATLSSANTSVGSAIARVSMLPTRLIGRTACFLAICAGTRFRASGSISSCETAIEGTPYWRERDPSSCSSATRSEEHTSELQSRGHLVCRLLLEKKKKNKKNPTKHSKREKAMLLET